MKKVLITGANGQLGYELQKTLPERYVCIATDKDSLDITDAYVVKEFVGEHQPDVIIRWESLLSIFGRGRNKSRRLLR